MRSGCSPSFNYHYWVTCEMRDGLIIILGKTNSVLTYQLRLMTSVRTRMTGDENSAEQLRVLTPFGCKFKYTIFKNYRSKRAHPYLKYKFTLFLLPSIHAKR